MLEVAERSGAACSLRASSVARLTSMTLDVYADLFDDALETVADPATRCASCNALTCGLASGDEGT